MIKSITRRLDALERGHGSQEGTAADIIQMLQKRPPRNADEFFLWERNLSTTERAAYMAVVEVEIAEFEKELMGEEDEPDEDAANAG